MHTGTTGPRRPLFLAAGSFGHAVTERLAKAYAGAVVMGVDEGSHPSFWPVGDLLVLVTDHPRQTLAEAVESSAYAWGVPWFPIELEPTELRCGPAVRPGDGACHRCFIRRRAQHDRSPVPRAAGTDPTRVTGYAPHHVGMAVALARAAVHDLFDGQRDRDQERDEVEHPARVRSVNLADGRTARNHVVAVDQCPRCRPARDGGDTSWRTFERLTAAAPVGS
ncbi:TOMM precursor leader peptide-binding protein [Streptomyces smyrnaeus]|uniref:TOMM precursor leader peptide-binding protein n=1 Tax=Streptomyces TaxID=1883 RepID=UPI000C19E762|nr:MULTISPECIES: TOMM precursor leader peptide-binding protein [unclassified Streptomyces]MBQ0863018.1 TOMM precursor leader peptide-binding protein [Streptomyces sp. RK75]MBQ1119370.1 TOMM precursor leader peptide-binding protein [Streptomyces sp. B15]MBQ1163043.1 TOMM precursor leader peptide-binding protein [Streptomyces sp. A73]